ncbi:MAG: AsmA-like C-terminal domain-containing protein [Maricaulaceae bacterium]
MDSVTPDIKNEDEPAHDHKLTAIRGGFLYALRFFQTWGKWALKFVLRGLAELTAVSLGFGIIWLGLITSIMAKGEADVSFLKQNFTLWFAQAYDGQDAEIETFKVQWHPERQAIGFLAEGIIVSDENQANLLTVTSIYTETPVSALVKRGFVAKRLDLVGGQFTIQRNKKGSVFGSVGGPNAFGRLGPIIPIVAAETEQELIDSVALHGTEVFFRDDNTGLSLDLEKVDFQTMITNSEIFGEGQAYFALPDTSDDTLLPELQPKVDISVKRERINQKALDLSINITHLNPSSISSTGGLFRHLEKITAPVTIMTDFRSVNDQERTVKFSVERADSRGVCELPLLGNVQNMSLRGEFDLIADTVNLSDVEIDATHGKFRGEIDLSNLMLQNSRLPVGFNVDLDALSWDAKEVFPKALKINKGQVKGTYNTSQGRLNLDQLALPISSYKLNAYGQVDNIGKGSELPLGLKLSGAVDGTLSEFELLSIWPIDFILGGRNWVKSSIVEASLSDMKFEFDIPDFSQIEGGLADDSVKLDFNISDGLVQYISTMTPLDKVSGSGSLRANGIDVMLTGGILGELAIETGRVKIPQFFPPGHDFTIDIEGSGPVDFMVELIDQKPFEYASIYSLSPQDFTGQGRVKFNVKRPLGSGYPSSRFHYDVELQASNISAPFGVGQYSLTEGELFLTANKKGMTIKGPARIGPLQADINWRENFDFGATPTSLSLTSHVDNATLDKLGLKLREYFGGIIPITLDASGEGVNFDEARISADLRDSELVIGDFWAKPKGEPGDLQLSIARNATGKIIVEDLTASASGLDISGALKLDDKLRLVEANLSTLHIDDFIDARMTLKRENIDHPMQATLSGDYLNLDGVVSSALWQPDGENAINLPLNLTANMNSLRLAQDYQINKASLLYNHSGQSVDQFRFSGGSEDGPVVLDLQTLETGPFVNRLTFDIANASDAVGAFFELDNIQGGRMFGEAVRPRDGNSLIWSGTLNVDDFTLTEAPFLTQILSLASLNGLSNVLTGSGLKFQTVELPFTWGEGVLGLEGARAAGPALGLTADGTIDLTNEALDMDGTLIPAYSANSFIDAIPIIGDILGGKADDATLGLTYGIAGGFDKAQVSVNPLSALTPGILRKIFKPEREKKRIAIPSDTDEKGQEEPSQSGN